ncbi:MAG: TolC family protein [Verrucomicrobiota bacterium]
MKNICYLIAVLWVISLTTLLAKEKKEELYSEKNEKEINKLTEQQVPVTPDGFVADPYGGEGQLVSVDWIQSFNDPTLLKLMQEAQMNNKDLQIAAARVEQALGSSAKAGAALVPTVDLAAGGSRSGNVDSGDQSANLGLGLQFNWEIDLWGRLRSGKRAAIASARAVEADFIYARHSLAAATAKGYFTAINANLQIQVAKENLEILEKTMKIVDVKHENGMISAQDVALTRSDLAVARERLVDVEGAQRETVRSLELLLGRYPQAELDVRQTLPDTPPLPPSGLPSELLERRPDIVAADQQVAVAFNRVKEAKAARLPRISLSSEIGGSSNSLTNLLNPMNVAWQMASNLLAPIFDGGSRKAQVEISTAEQKEALAAYGKTALTAFGEVESSLDQGYVLYQREQELQTAVTEAEKALKIAQLRYDEGEIELIDLLSIQTRVITAKSNLLSVQSMVLQQRVNLFIALGGGWEGLK